MADWQRGFDLERLRALAAPFKKRHKSLVFGAFGLVKERDIADYLARGRLAASGDPPRAVALLSELRSNSAQADFAQRELRVPAGAVYVRALAALDQKSGRAVLDQVLARAGTGLLSNPVVVEIFEEDDVAKRCVEKLGLRYVATKISAGSEIKGVYSSAPSLCLPALGSEEAATLCVLKRGFLTPAQHKAVLAEFEGAAQLLAQHYSNYNKRKSWTALALRGYSDDPSFIIKPAEMSRSWKEENAKLLDEPSRWTSVADKLPVTREVVERLGLKLDRVRFMRLRSKDGELSRHADITDREAGVRDGFVTRLHIPVRTSDAVTFFGWSARGEKLEAHLPERSLCYLDQRKPHAVKNTDPSLDRVHLVVDCFADAKLRGMIGRAEERRA